jgi:hypothetical protein
MKTFEIEFSRKTTYRATITVEDSMAEIIADLEYDEVPMYSEKLAEHRWLPNPLYEVLNDAASEGNVFEDEELFEGVNLIQ